MPLLFLQIDRSTCTTVHAALVCASRQLILQDGRINLALTSCVTHLMCQCAIAPPHSFPDPSVPEAPGAILLYECQACAGHWSRDCTLAPSQWQTKPAEAPAARPTPPPAPSTPAANCTSTQGTPAHRSGEFGGYSRGTDAQRPGEGPLQQRPKGCYKCGKSGGGPRSLTCML